MGFKIKQLWKAHRKDKKKPKKLHKIERGEDFIRYLGAKSEENFEPLIQEEEEKPKKTQEEIVLESYEKEIANLKVRESLKEYLRRTLDTVVNSKDNEKIFLLEMRDQLKYKEQEGHNNLQYSSFLKFIDRLYLLALDKSISRAQSTQDIEEVQQQQTQQETQQQVGAEENQSSSQTLLHEISRYFLSDTHQQIRSHITASLRRRLGSLASEVERIDGTTSSRDEIQPEEVESSSQERENQPYLTRWPFLHRYMPSSFFQVYPIPENERSNESIQNNITDAD